MNDIKHEVIGDYNLYNEPLWPSYIIERVHNEDNDQPQEQITPWTRLPLASKDMKKVS